MRKKFIATMICGLAVASGFGVDKGITHYSASDCQGSYLPYPAPENSVALPDSLTPVFISYIGRHGARFPSSDKNALLIKKALQKADSLGTLTGKGREMLSITDMVLNRSSGQWGALDSLGMSEQRGIAQRMMENFPALFRKGGAVHAISSYSPRVMMSMYSFTHEMDRLNTSLEFTTTTGNVNDLLVRPFEVEEDYLKFRDSGQAERILQEYIEKVCPTSAVERILGMGYPFKNSAEAKKLALAQYYVLAGLGAMGIEYDLLEMFSEEELNGLWSCFNMRQYLQRTATELSDVPAAIAGPLLQNIISSIDSVVEGNSTLAAFLRFGHAETIMPLVSLMQLPGCYYKTADLEDVAWNWKNFYVVPMASNLQFILLRGESGEYYLRLDFNEKPIALIPGDTRVYLTWKEARKQLESCLPAFYQPLVRNRSRLN